MSHSGKSVNSSFLFRMKRPIVLTVIFFVMVILHLCICVSIHAYIHVIDTHTATVGTAAFLGIIYSSPPYSAMEAFFLFPSLCEFHGFLWILKLQLFFSCNWSNFFINRRQGMAVVQPQLHEFCSADVENLFLAFCDASATSTVNRFFRAAKRGQPKNPSLSKCCYLGCSEW